MKNFATFDSQYFKDRFGCLTEELQIKRNKTLNQMWIPLFFFRRFSYSAILIMMPGYPLFQLGASVCFSIVMLAWLVLVRPFETKVGNALQIINESCILCCFITSFVFLDGDRSSRDAKLATFSILGLIVCDIGINLSIIGYITIVTLLQKFRKVIHWLKTRRLK